MRNYWLVCGAALLLAACGQENTAEQTTNSGDQVTAESIGGNDITAIDAATGSDANMAADVEFNVEDLNSLEGNEGAEAADNEG